MSAPRQAAQANGAAGLAFILGFPRSGTTLLGQILASSPQILLLEEKPLLARAAQDFMERSDGIARLAALRPSERESYRADFWNRVRSFGGEYRDKFVVDQTAFNTVYLPAIGGLFTDAKIVFAIRDPRDVVFSCFRRQFVPTPFTLEFHSLESTARFYDWTMNLAELCRTKAGIATFEIRYEELVAAFDRETGRLCEYLGVAWSPAMRDFQRGARERSLATRSAAQVRKGLTGDYVGTWRRYRDRMAPVLPTLAPWVERFGYPPD